MTPDYTYNKEELLDDIQKSVSKYKAEPSSDEKMKDLFKKLDESNPVEQEMMFDMVKKNPPDPDFMRVTVEHDLGGDGGLVSRNSMDDTVFPVDPLFVFSPYLGFKADIAKAPLNVVPMLIDEAMNVVAEEKKAHKPVKRKDDKQMGWILFTVFAVIASVGAGAFLLMRFLGG